jgi:hypothetical protein
MCRTRGMRRAVRRMSLVSLIIGPFICDFRIHREP